MTVSVLRPGLLTTVQDHGYMPRGGDPYAIIPEQTVSISYYFYVRHNPLHRRQRRQASKRRWAAFRGEK